jgi:hypothetical protein
MTELGEQISHEFARDIVKRARVFLVQGKKQVYLSGERINFIFLPLFGNIFFRNRTVSKSDEERTLKDIYHSLIEKASRSAQKGSTKGFMGLEKRSSFAQI